MLKGCREGNTEKVTFKNSKGCKNESYQYLGERSFQAERIGKCKAC